MFAVASTFLIAYVYSEIESWREGSKMMIQRKLHCLLPSPLEQLIMNSHSDSFQNEGRACRCSEWLHSRLLSISEGGSREHAGERSLHDGVRQRRLSIYIKEYARTVFDLECEACHQLTKDDHRDVRMVMAGSLWFLWYKGCRELPPLAVHRQ